MQNIDLINKSIFVNLKRENQDNELSSVHRSFDEHTKVVCEEFEVTYK